MRRRWGIYGGLLLGTMLTGAAVRFGSAGLPAGVVKYGGSGMWAACFYWGFRMLGVRVGWAAAWASGVTAGVEWFKRYRSPGVDRFRGTMAGVLLLGRFFSWWDVVAYLVAIAVAAWMDAVLVEGRRRSA